jgi:hypothetical protein
MTNKRLTRQDYFSNLLEQHQRRVSEGDVYAWFRQEADYTGMRVQHVWLEIENRTALPIYVWQIENKDIDFEIDSDGLGALPPGRTKLNVTEETLQTSIATTLGGRTPRLTVRLITPSGEALTRDAFGKLITTPASEIARMPRPN